MIRLRNLATVLATGLMACACVVVPRTETSFDPDCRITTHHMTLDTVQIGRINNCSYKQDCVVVMLGLGVTAASAIVSGSIAVAGNVAYWAEQRAGCAATVPASAQPVTPVTAQAQPSA